MAAVAAAIIAVAALNCLFPFCVDDFYWATRPFSWTSVTELNGRYLGSALSLIITKAAWLRPLICALVTVAVIYAVSLNGAGGRLFYFAVAAALFAVMPISIFSEAVAWASGFANYMPSALIAVTYVALVRREFSSKAPAYGRAAPYIAAAMGIVGALFVETVTIGNVVVGAAVLIYHFIRFKKPSGTLIAFLAGAIVGAVLMFVNPVYLTIFSEGDPEQYRSVRAGLTAIKECYLYDFQYYFLYDNLPLNAVIAALFAWLAIKRLPAASGFKRAVIIICFVVQAAFLARSCTTLMGYEPFPLTVYKGHKLNGILTFLFAVSILLETLLLIKDINVRLNCIFIIGAAVAYSMPLLIVEPIAPRAFLVDYLLYIIFAIILLTENLNGRRDGEKGLIIGIGCAAAAVTVAIGALYFVKYAQIHSVYVEREAYIAQQVKIGAEEIRLVSVPSEAYIFNNEVSFTYFADPVEGDDGAFRLYYGIPYSTVIIVE